jgi:nitrilase
MNSGANVDANLKLADALLADAAADKVRLAVLPENFALMAKKSRDKAAFAEARGRGPIQEFLADAARRHGMWIVAGSMPVVSPEAERVFGA